MRRGIDRRRFLKFSGLAGVAAAAGCSDRGRAGRPRKPSAGRRGGADEEYVMVSNVGAHPYWLDAQYGGRDAAGQLGVKWRYAGPADFDTPAQVSALEQLIATRPAGMLVAALQPDALVNAISKAVDAGIPVVTVDTDAPESKRMAYLGTNNHRAGCAMGQEMLNLLPNKGKVGLVSVPGQFNLEERIRGIREAFARSGKRVQAVSVVDGKNDDSATADAVVAMLQSNPEIDLVGSINAVGAGVAAALRQTNKVGKVKAVTFDVTEPIVSALEEGIISVTMVQRTYMMTYLGVRFLFAHNHQTEYLANWSRNGLPILPESVDTGVMAITKENAAAFKQAGA